MKIAFVVEYYPPHIGGVEALFRHLAEGMCTRGNDVTVFTSSLPNTKSNEVLNDVRIERIKLPSFGTRYWFTFIAAIVLLPRLRGFDVIHTTTYNAALPAWLCAALLRKPIVLTVHEVWGSLWFHLGLMNRIMLFLHWLFEQAVIRLPYGAYVGVSDSTVRQLSNIHGTRKRIQRIYHGIDYDFFNRSKYDGRAIRNRLGLEKNFVYLYYGRPGWAKGIVDLIDAVPHIVKEVPAAKLLLLISRDPLQLYKRIYRRIQALGVQSHVILHDSVTRTELPNYIIAANCVVIPSLSEGFGFSAAESCALEVPVAVSRAGSLPEVVSGAVRFFEPGNPQSIASAVTAIARGSVEKIPSKRFYWKDSINAYVELYRTLLETS